MPVLNRLGEQYAAQGVVVIAINVGESETRYQDYVASEDLTYVRWARDGTRDTGRAYNIRAIPVSYVVDAQGVIRFAHLGYHDSLEDKLSREIASLLE